MIIQYITVAIILFLDFYSLIKARLKKEMIVYSIFAAITVGYLIFYSLNGAFEFSLYDLFTGGL